MKELKELFKSLGYVGGEIADISKDGLGIEDLASVKEIYDNRGMLKDGFNVEGDFKEHLKGLGIDALADIIAEAKVGYELGLK